MPILENVPLAPYTTLGVGGPARYFAAVTSEAELEEALAFATQNRLPVFVLGGGSNLVIADRGFPGLVVQPDLRGIEISETGDGTGAVTVGAGEDWDSFVRFSVEHDLQGIECLAGIPGRVGGTPVQNVGAYGQEVAETITTVRALHTPTRETVIFATADCGFAYRRSRFNSVDSGQWIILSVTFALRRGASPLLAYADLKTYFANHAEPPTLHDVYKAVREIRSRKGMVVRADDPDSRSAGSFFKNPVVTQEQANAIQLVVQSPVPRWLQPDGSVKMSAAWLIENSGFQRGQALGKAGLSTKHILALTNRGGAAAIDIITLALQIQVGVKQRWDILLAPEPVFVGFQETDTVPLNATRYP